MFILGLIKGLVVAHWLDAAILLFLLGVLVFMYIKGYKNLVKKIVLALVVQAEQQLGSTTGMLKLETVIAGVYSRLPLMARLLIPKDFIVNSIEGAVGSLKNYLGTPVPNSKGVDATVTPNLLTLAEEQFKKDQDQKESAIAKMMADARTMAASSKKLELRATDGELIGTIPAEIK